MTTRRPADDQKAARGKSDADHERDSWSLPVPIPSLGDESDGRVDAVEPRPYIEIRPSETTLTPGTVVGAMEELQAFLADSTNRGLKPTLFRSAQIPRVEWLLLSDGRADPHVRYLVGSTHVALTDDLMGILRRCFPDSYEFRVVEWHPLYAEEFLPISRPGAEDQRVGFANGASIDTSIEPYVAGVEFRGHADRRLDWQTPLQSFDAPSRQGSSERSTRWSGDRDVRPKDHTRESHRVSLAGLLETLSDATVPVLYQVVLQAHEDWSVGADSHLTALQQGSLSIGDQVRNSISPRTREQRQAYEPPRSDRDRIEGIRSRACDQTVCLSARAVALTRDDPSKADTIARRLSKALHSVDGRFHTVEGHVVTDGDLHPQADPPGSQVYADLLSRAIYPAAYDSFRARLPGTQPRSRGIVVAADELPGFCVVDGAGLTPAGQRALAARRRERTAVTLPPPGQLVRYSPPGMALCMPLTHDRQPYGRPLYLRPSQQDRHLVVVGDTGSGKSVLLERAVLSNAEATAGPEILFDYKGGGTAVEYLKGHYAEHGDFEDVLYFDLSRVLPALSFFDIGPLLEAGVPREEARSRKAGHYEEILQGILGAEKYGEAAASVKAIRNHLRALYDPVHGDDAVSHADLYHALQRSQRGDSMPPTTDETLTAYFEGLRERDRDIFTKIMGGAVGRVETIATDARLAPVFDHVPDGDDGPSFDFAEHLDDDCVIVFDFGGMEGSVKRTLTLVILSNLWTALKAREQDARRSDGDRDLPLVNLYLEEAREVGATRLLDTLLAEGRSFGLSIALGLQFVEQLDSPDPQRDTYREALNETATFVAGNVSVDSELSRVLATDAMAPDDVDRRLGSMGRGEWLVRPGTDFGEEPVKPFLAESLPAPAGHPASESPLSGRAESAFRAAVAGLQQETAAATGLVQGDLDVTADEDATDTETETDAESDEGVDPDAVGKPRHSERRVDTLLPHTNRMPKRIHFDAETDAIVCEACGNRYESAIEGMVRAIECCHNIDRVKRDSIPICDVNLKLSREEIADSEWSLKQLLFVQAVYNAQQLRYDPREYDIERDSMVRIQEYVGIDTDAIQELLDADLVRHDGDHPHRLYSVSPDGRTAIGEAYRHGVDYGDGKGDLEESSEHVFGVQVGIRLLEQEYQDDPDSDVVRVKPYHELETGDLPASAFFEGENTVPEDTTAHEQRRLDVAGLDEDGNVVVAMEVERVNNDHHRAVLDDFDKMAACEPEEAIWIVLRRKDAHTVLEALNTPLDGDVRVEKSYSRNTPPQQFTLDTPGMTDVYPAGWVRDELLESAETE